jgi:hypothetical protein
LHNPQTQKEAGAWVSRFGHPRGGLSQVGVEFVRPEEDFWSKEPVKPSGVEADGANGNGSQASNQVSSGAVAPESGLVATGTVASPADVLAMTAQSSSPSDITAPPRTASPGILLQALEQTLRQAAEQAVSTAATGSLGTAVNHAAAAIDSFSYERMRQMEERLAQRHNELQISAREDVLTRVQALVARYEEQLKQRAEEFADEAARNAHSDFTGQLRDTTHQVVTQFAEEAIGSSTQHFATLAERINSVANEAQARLQSAVAEAVESQTKARRDMEHAVADAQQKFESLSLLLNGAFANCDARVRAFQEDLAGSKDQELERFRERLRNVLTTLLTALG